MKKLFQYTKKPHKQRNFVDAGEDWDMEEYYEESEEVEEEYYVPEPEEVEEAYYAQESEDMEEEYYAREPEEVEEEYYVPESEEVEEAYYAQEPEEVEEEYYAREPEDMEEEYYAREPEEVEEEYYAREPEDMEEEYYAQESEDMEEVYYAQESEDMEEVYYAGAPEDFGEEYDGPEAVYYEDEEELYALMDIIKPGTNKRRKKSMWNQFLDMSIMDRVIMATGVVVLIVALITGGFYFSMRSEENQISELTNVGAELQELGLIGEKGLLAVADAERAKQAAAEALLQQQEEENKEYNENEYDKTVTISLNMNSVQKDLKIKFVNKETGKLVANVPFSVNITTPEGNKELWSDEDMDGIIYKKGITPGSYKVEMNAFTEARYADYILPTGKQLVEVKKDIAYKKVDVSDEVKTEAEIDASVEDTKKNETVVESALQDTVEWVESTSTVNTYTEVSKGSIPDPLTLAVNNKSFMRVAYGSVITPSSKNLAVGSSFTVEAKCVDSASNEVEPTMVTWKSSNLSVAKVSGSGKSATVTAVGTGSALISYEAVIQDVSGNNATTKLTGTCSVTVGDVAGSLSVDKNMVTIAPEAQITVKAIPSGFANGRELSYTVISSNNEIATATVDANGMVTVKGVAEGEIAITVTVNYKSGENATAASTIINVKVSTGAEITLDKTAATVYLTAPTVINASLTNTSLQGSITAESSDTAIATVAVSNQRITITGVKEGSATITVKYTENGTEVKATCAVTVKGHPKEDKTSLLKDSSNRQLYVLENETYREAVFADYYTAEKFFVKGLAKYTGWQTIDGKVYYYTASGDKVTGEQIIQGAKYNFASDGSLVTGSGTLGIDVSKWNGRIDWNAVKNSGVSYVIIRCGYRGSSQGMLVEDPRFAANIKGATNAGLKVGVYFFSQAVDEVEAVYEASFVLDKVKNYRISYPIFLDVEPSGGRGDKIDKATRTAVCKAFCQTIQNAGYTAGIYANKTWLNGKIDAGALGNFKIWLAQYASTPSYTGRYDIWQYKSTGRVSGIKGDVDMNLSYLGY